MPPLKNISGETHDGLSLNTYPNPEPTSSLQSSPYPRPHLNTSSFMHSCCSIEVQREGAKFERAALDKYGLRVILSWQEEDQDKRETAEKEKETESKQESQLKFKGWTKRKDERRIRMPVEADVKDGGIYIIILYIYYIYFIYYNITIAILGLGYTKRRLAF